MALALCMPLLFGARPANAASVVESAVTVGATAQSSCGTAGTPSATVYLPNITKTFGGPDGWDTPFYIQNAGAVQTTVEATFSRFSDGAVITCRKTTGLAPGTALTDDPARDEDLPDDTQFSVVLRSFGAPVVAAVDQLQGVGPTTEALSYTGFGAGARTVYLPNVTRRFFGYDVPFIIQNVGSAVATVSVRFLSFDGTRSLTLGRVIDPGKSKVVDPDSDDALLGAPGLVDGTQYAVTLTSTQPIAVVANAHDEAIGPVAFSHNGLAVGGQTLFAPYAMKLVNSLFSPVVVQNIGTTSADATLTFSPLGTSGGAQTFTLRGIPAGGARAFDPRFTLGTTTPCTVAGPNCLGPGEYSLRIDSASQIAAVVLPNSSSTAAAYLATPSMQTRTVLPVVMRTVGGGNGWTTSVYVQPGSTTSATVRYYALDTGELVATQQVALPPNGARLDPRTVPGLRDNAKYSMTVDGNGGTLTAVAHQQAFTGGDASMMYEGFATASLPTVPQPASIRVRPEGSIVIAGATGDFTASVNDQFGVPLPSAPLTWSSSAGTIASNGLFTAGATNAAGTVTAASAGVSTSVAVSVQVPAPTVVAGIALVRVTAPAFDLYAQPTIALADKQRLLVNGMADTAQVQSDYLANFANRPSIYVLATSAAFSAAAQTIGGGSAPPTWASGVCVCDTDHNWVFVNWETAASDNVTVRHELTHAMEHDLSADADLPAWFNEGNARQEEFTLEGMQWEVNEERYRAASMARSGALFTLDALTSQFVWGQRNAFDATYEYAVATQAAAFVRADVGMLGVLDLLRRLASDESFADAYAAVAHRSLDTFAASFGARVRALAPAYPGIATSPDTPTGPGLAFAIYGLPANAPFTLDVVGTNGFSLVGGPQRTADAYGFYTSFLSTGWPPGTYTISASYAGGVVSVTAVKPATASVSFSP